MYQVFIKYQIVKVKYLKKIKIYHLYILLLITCYLNKCYFKKPTILLYRMSNYGQGIMAYDNKRKVMRSTIFENDDPSPSVPFSYQPKYANQEQTQNVYSNSGNENRNANSNKYASQSSNYQTSNYKKQNSYSANAGSDVSIRMPQIEPVEIPPPLPTLTPFPEFRFDSVSPIGQIDLGVHPRDPSSVLPKQDDKNSLNAIVFEIGGALQKIRDDLTQESLKCTQKMENLTTNTQNLQLNVELLNIPTIENIEDQQQINEAPQFTTSSQFMFPDGTTVENS